MKRIVCVLLTLIMLLSLVPMGASAASHTVSEAAITVLKQMTKFESSCAHYSGNEFRIGYGTVCKGEGHKVDISTGKGASDTAVHEITQLNADKALREALKALDTKINSFATANGLSLSQHQHDALVVFTYGVGEAWLNGTGTLKNAIIKGADANTLLNAMSQFGDVDRRKVEANMYLNGIYSNTYPANFCSVTYQLSEGYMAQGNSYTMYYDADKSMNHVPTPSHSSKQFMGWYTEATGGTWVPVLTKSQNGKTLYAHFAAADTSVAASYTLDVSYISPKTVYKNDLKTANGDKLNLIAGKTTVQVTGEKVDASGNHWCKLGDDAWVKVGTVSTGYLANAQIRWTVTVTNSYVNRRVNADAASAKNGSYKQGDKLDIIEEDGGWLSVGEVKDDGTVEAVGWVSSIYTDWGTVQDGATGAQSTNVIGNATVTFPGYLNIRQEAGTDAKIVAALAQKDTVELYEIKTVNGHQWGRIKSGWICLTYTKLSLLENVVISDAGSKAYTFSAKTLNKLTPRVAAGNENNVAQYKDHNGAMKELSIPSGKTVNLSNLLVVGNDTWAKATWANAEKNTAGKDINVTRSGWVILNDTNVKLDPVKYTVAVDTLNARTSAGNQYDMKFYLNKGSQVEVSKIRLVDENIWGYITVIKAVGSGAVGSETGWINLASKYVTRGDLAADIEGDSPTISGKIGTVINTDALKVRQTGATYGAQLGTLSRGTTVTIWESNEDGWYKVDSNQNGTYDYEGDGWVSGNYLDVRTGTAGGNTTATDAAGNKYETDGTGKGIVANTYAGVNVRAGAGTGYAFKGKLLPGTVVEILELANGGKWGRTAQGWVSMDYITMLTYNQATSTTTPQGGVQVESFDKADRTSTTAVYTGKTTVAKSIFAEPDLNSEEIRITAADENVTIHELSAVTQTIEQVDTLDPQITHTKKTTTYWARVNDGWIYLPSGTNHIALNALDEKVHTLTGTDEITPEGTTTKLKKGDQVSVTALEIRQDKVWGRVETETGAGWVNLSNFSEGALYEKPAQTIVTPSVTTPTIGAGSSAGGYVTNTSGYRYTGSVIRANELNVRATPSTGAAKTTTLKNGQAVVIYETTQSEGMAWGRCDAGWVYLYYIDLVPVTGAVDARVVANENTVAYTDANCSAVAGTYARQSVIDIYEIVGKMARTELGWVNTDNLL